jgi:glycosyltransferase involved in cell wall biosynthesis
VAERRYRVLAICGHPVQYMAHILRGLAVHPEVELRVAYCSLRGVEAGLDPEFGTSVQWDIPLLDGYVWEEIANRGSGKEEFFGLYNPRLWSLIRRGNFDAVMCFTGYVRASFWISYFASKLSRSAFLFGCDQNSLEPRDGRTWKRWAKKLGWPILYGLADQVVVSSTAARSLILSLGISESDVTLTPLAVDNDWWKQQSESVDRSAIRAQWRAGPESSVILFCAKLQPWKRPLDLLQAFAKANLDNAMLVYAGEGPLRGQLEVQASSLGIAAKVKFLGFVNQSQLPAIYTAADLMVLPSEYEPFAVVVNEASCCGCAVAASDHVGAARDLILPVHPELVYPCGNVEALTRLLQTLVSDHRGLAERGQAARRHMETWSPERNISATVRAIQLAVARIARRAGVFPLLRL